MKGVFEFNRIYLHRAPVDGRKMINGLSVIIETEMQQNPFDKALFVFTNRRRNVVRCLYWDHSGFAFWMKRLEQEKFRWPLKYDDDVITFTPQQLAWLLDGYDVMRMKPHQSLSYASVC